MSSSPSPEQPQAAKPDFVFTLGRAILRPYLWLRHRPIISGTHHVPATGGVLIASNHLATLDTILIPTFSPRKVQFLAKASLFEGRIKNWFFRHIGAVPVFREAGASSQESLEAGERVLQAGQVFAVFPEGSRSRDGRLYRGRSGVAFLAFETGATVIPVGLIATDKRKDARTGRARRVEMRFGPPVAMGDLEGLPGGRARKEATERIMNAIHALTGQERADTYAEGGRGA